MYTALLELSLSDFFKQIIVATNINIFNINSLILVNWSAPNNGSSYILHVISLLTGKYELNKLTSLPMCGFIAQLVEHRTGIAEVTGSNPVEALIFSGFFFPIA